MAQSFANASPLEKALLGASFLFFGLIATLGSIADVVQPTMTAQTTGHVTGYAQQRALHPIVTFELPSGASETITSSYGTSTAERDFPIGLAVTVRYDPANPKDAVPVEIDKEGRRFFFFLGPMFMVIGAFSLWHRGFESNSTA